MNSSTLLVPIDFSENAIIALKFAIGLAKDRKSELVLLHVHDDNNPNEVFRDNLSPSHQMDLWSNFARNQGCKVNPIMVRGGISDSILETAKKLSASMIIMGTKGAGNNLQRLIGSNASHVVTNALCPVLVIPQGIESMNISKVVVAIDPAIENDQTVSWVSKYLCTPHTQMLLWSSSSRQTQTDTIEYHKRLIQIIKQKEPECKIDSKVKDDGNAATELEEFFKDLDADLLVLTTHHRGFIEKLFDSSLTINLTLRADIPILAIPQVKTPVYFF
ncbi:MAG: hypothetical protein RL090_1743 [Bacteroidota bacterium]